MESEILNNLNDEQRIPASTINGAVLVTAGAGSGKTRMLTHRIAHMVSEVKINPDNILAITFTNKAANEMKERLAKMIENLGDMWICTFHAMCSRILRRDIDKLSFLRSFSIYGDTEKKHVIKRIAQDLNTDINAETFMWHISNAKNNLLSPDEYKKFIRDPKKCNTITQVFKGYEQELFKANALDFDDLIVKTFELFKKFPEVLEYYQNKFKYIFVDEFQDTNTSQYELVKILACKNKNILAVGDEDQCIYSWRGAHVENVKQFTKDFEGCLQFKLERNYRSTKNIIALANKLIKNNTNRIDKNLWTENCEGEEVEFKQLYNDGEEAEWLAEKIEYLVKNTGANYSDFAVLMRVNSLSRVIEEKLLTYNIPYRIFGGFKFFERKEIKDTTAYLYLVANPNDTEATMRMLAFPKKRIGDASILSIKNLSEQFNVSMMDIIMNARNYGVSGALLSKLDEVATLFDDLNQKKEVMPIEDFVDYVIKRVGIKEAIGQKTEEDISKCMNVDDLVKSVTEFSENNPGASIDDFLQSITLMRDIDEMNDEDNFVSLLTVHASKGLEFKNVFIIGLNDGLFPLSRAINSADPNELEEERRLLYVAITRAQNRLFLSRPKVRFNYESKRSDYAVASRFLGEIFDDMKLKQTKNGCASWSNVEDTGFSEFLNNSKKQAEMDRYLSSHINIVDVSNSKQTTSTSQNTNNIKVSDYSKFKTGVKVKHKHFGDGVITLGVTDFASAFVTIKFEKVGIKTLSLKYAQLEIISEN